MNFKNAFVFFHIVSFGYHYKINYLIYYHFVILLIS